MSWTSGPAPGVRARPGKAPVALWQALLHIGARRVNEPNTLTWNELMSSDLAAALQRRCLQAPEA